MPTDNFRHPTAERSYISPRHLWIALYVMVSIGAGLAILLVDPIVVFGIIGLIVMTILLFRYPYLGVLVYIVFEYARLPAMFPALAPLQIGKLIVVPTLLIWFIRHAVYRDSKIISESAYNWFLLWLGVALVSASQAVDSSRSFEAVLELTKWFIICFLIINVVNNLPKWKWLMWLLLLLNFKMSQFQIRGFATGLARSGNADFFIQQGKGAGSTGFFANATDFGLAMVVVLPLALYLVHACKSKLLKLVPLVFVATFTISILNSGSRGAAVAMFVVAVLYWFKQGRKPLPAIAMLVLVGGFWLMSSDAWRTRFESAQDHEQDATATHRIELWKAGIRMVSDHPLTGVGLENFGHAFNAEYRPAYMVGGASAPHNIFVQAGAELGPGGLVALVGLIVLVFRRNYQTRKILDQAGIEDRWILCFSHGLDLSLAGYIVGGFFLTVLYYPHLFIVSSLSFALHHITKEMASKVAKEISDTS